MIKRIIFDVDNTLITNVNFKSAVEKAFEEYGLNTNKYVDLFVKNISKYEETHKGYNKEDYLDFYKEILKVSLEEDFLKIYFNELSNLISNNSVELKNMLKKLDNYELVLLSNYFEESQRGRLRKMGIDKYFKEYYGEKIIKPYKEAYISAKGKYKESECLIVGDDYIKDIKVPKELGFNTCYVNKNGQGDILKVEDLIDYIKKIND